MVEFSDKNEIINEILSEQARLRRPGISRALVRWGLGIIAVEIMIIIAIIAAAK